MMNGVVSLRGFADIDVPVIEVEVTQTESSDDEIMMINPCTSLPIMGNTGVDIGGNAFGTGCEESLLEHTELTVFDDSSSSLFGDSFNDTNCFDDMSCSIDDGIFSNDFGFEEF